MQNMLSALDYGFDMAERPDKTRIRFQRIVRTFKFKDLGDVWEGEVVEVSHPDDPRPFGDRMELAQLLEDRVFLDRMKQPARMSAPAVPTTPAASVTPAAQPASAVSATPATPSAQPASATQAASATPAASTTSVAPANPTARQ